MYLFIPLFDASNLDPSILTWSYQMTQRPNSQAAQLTVCFLVKYQAFGQEATNCSISQNEALVLVFTILNW